MEPKKINEIILFVFTDNFVNYQNHSGVLILVYTFYKSFWCTQVGFPILGPLNCYLYLPHVFVHYVTNFLIVVTIRFCHCAVVPAYRNSDFSNKQTQLFQKNEILFPIKAKYVDSYAMLHATWYRLYLVPFTEACATLLKVTLLHGCFHFFEQNVSYSFSFHWKYY